MSINLGYGTRAGSGGWRDGVLRALLRAGLAVAVTVGVLFGIGVLALFAYNYYSYEPPPFDRLDRDGLFAAAGFRCSFEEMELDVAIDAVSFEGENRFGSATLIGNNGTADMTAVRGYGSMSFIEVTPGGWANLLTVYALRRVDGGFEAVYARHTGGGSGFPNASHDEGACHGVPF